MNGVAIRMGAFAALLGIGWPAIVVAQGTPVQLICQSYLAQQDCTEVSGGWPGGAPLTFVASCIEYCGQGADMKECGTGEKVTVGVLAMETAQTQPVSGAFTQVKQCIGLPFFSFSGSLQAGTSYNVVANLGDPHGRVEILGFSAAGSVTGTDGGSPQPGVDSGVGPTPDGGGKPIPGSDGSIPSTRDGSSNGGRDGSTDSGTGDSGGCDCRVAGGGVPAAGLLLLLIIGLRRRR